jgi:hypothetical protein
MYKIEYLNLYNDYTNKCTQLDNVEKKHLYWSKKLAEENGFIDGYVLSMFIRTAKLLQDAKLKFDESKKRWLFTMDNYPTESLT